MDFGTAINNVVHGHAVTRAAWDGTKVIKRDGDVIRSIGTVQGEYTPSQADMLADDWGWAAVVPADPDADGVIELSPEDAALLDGEDAYEVLRGDASDPTNQTGRKDRDDEIDGDAS